MEVFILSHATFQKKFQLKNDGYTNIDGLDPSQGFLDAAQRKKLYRNVINCYVTPDEQTPIAEGIKIDPRPSTNQSTNLKMVHYFWWWCPSVRPSIRTYVRTYVRTKQNKPIKELNHLK